MAALRSQIQRPDDSFTQNPRYPARTSYAARGVVLLAVVTLTISKNVLDMLVFNCAASVEGELGACVYESDSRYTLDREVLVQPATRTAVGRWLEGKTAIRGDIYTIELQRTQVVSLKYDDVG